MSPRPMSLEAALEEERKEVMAMLERGSGQSPPGPTPTMSPRPMSLEAALEEERREVMAMLERSSDQSPPGSTAAITPKEVSPPSAKTQLPVRSMLDIVVASTSAPTSIPRASHTTTSQQQPASRSMLDTDSPSPAQEASMGIRAPSTDANHGATKANNLKHQGPSDAVSNPGELGRRAPGFELPSAFQLSQYMPRSPVGPTPPKRNSQAGKRMSLPNVMASVARVGDWSSLGVRSKGGDGLASTTGSGTTKATSPYKLLGMRAGSPRHDMPSTDPSKLVLDDGRLIDRASAARCLSDIDLFQSAKDLYSRPEESRRRRASSGDITGSSDARVEKEGEDSIPDGSNEGDRSSDDERRRGRKKGLRDIDINGTDAVSKTQSSSHSKASKTALSSIPPVQDARPENRAPQKAKCEDRSMMEPEITVTGSSGERLRPPKALVHPNTSFDEGASGYNTPVDSDAEADLSDIKRAQKLSINMTPIVSATGTGRCVRTIYRGDFAQMQQEAHDNHRRVRKYLVATDLSEEAAHALEWTIGTVLRDGDTLLAIYCVDEEVGIVPAESSGDDPQLQTQAGATTSSAKPINSTPVLSAIAVSAGLKAESKETSISPMGRGEGKAEQERIRAVRDITDIVARLLRKTKLQVKVVIEVIHCKSPKHLITEVIDYITPTLVILGSRGRSALKGVILGSFSNYLVTKSSVPVMVARKRLRKHSKYKRPAIRLANNLANPAVSGLASAKID